MSFKPLGCKQVCIKGLTDIKRITGITGITAIRPRSANLVGWQMHRTNLQLRGWTL
jgi:hypothetical protein